MNKEKYLPSTLKNKNNLSVKGNYKEVAKSLCTCHHKCHDTTDCVVEDEALLLINQDKSNNFDVKSNEELFKQALVEGVNRHIDKTIEEAKKIEQIEKMAKTIFESNPLPEMWMSHARICAEALYDAGYRKQSEGEWVWTESGTEDYEQYWLCSCCNNKSYWKSKFCEECGAKMKGGE